MFNFKLSNISILNIPISLRQNKNIAWIKVWSSGFKRLEGIFINYRSKTLFYLAHNGQVIYLEHILNNRFNPDQNSADPDYEGNGIYIEDGLSNSETYIFNTSENGANTFLHNSSEGQFDEVYLYNSIEMQPLVGFIIWVPDTFVIDENELKALVNGLKLAGKLYTIKYYTI